MCAEWRTGLNHWTMRNIECRQARHYGPLCHCRRHGIVSWHHDVMSWGDWDIRPDTLFSFFFFHPIYYICPSFLSLLVVTQIRGHIAGSSPPSPVRFVPCFVLARRFQLFLPSLTRNIYDTKIGIIRIINAENRCLNQFKNTSHL